MSDEKYKVTRRKVRDYIPDNRNANAGTERGAGMLEDSLRAVGAGRSLTADAHGRIPAGNKTLQAAVDAGFEDVIEIETDGRALIVHKRRDWDLNDPDPNNPARKYAYLDNRVSEVGLSWDAGQIAADIEAGMNLSQMFSAKELVDIVGAALDEINAGDNLLTKWDVPDAVWPTNNDYGIPLLDINLQADAVDLPVTIWGSTSRKARMNGTWLFYTEDSRFNPLWDDPTPIINSGCVNVVEPNFSIYSQMPMAVALWAIYRKRWLARYWQSFGKRVFVDLNVNEQFYDLNLMGVPQGWKAYATRGYSERLEMTEQEYEMACSHAGTSSILFVVYGGGKAVKERAKERGWLWFREDMDGRAPYASKPNWVNAHQ